jgi:hydrogenase maturation protease
MARALVIGYGNTLRADDGLGPAVAEWLESEWADEDVRVLACQLLTPELAEPVSRAEMVVFIDATAAGRPGEVSCARVEPDRARASSFTHHFDPAGLLALAEELYGRAPAAYALTVCGESFDCTEGLTETVAARVPEVAEKARELVRRALAGRP